MRSNRLQLVCSRTHFGLNVSRRLCPSRRHLIEDRDEYEDAVSADPAAAGALPRGPAGPGLAVVGLASGGLRPPTSCGKEFGVGVKLDVFEAAAVGGPARHGEDRRPGTLEESMLAAGFSQVFLNDVVGADHTRQLRPERPHQTALWVQLALAGADSGLWAVDGGNKRGKSDIVFPGFSPPVPSHYPGRYHQTVSTLVHGILNVSYLGTREKASDFRVSEVLTTDSEGCPLHSLSSLDPVSVPPDYRRPPASRPKVWKIFSPRPLSEAQLDAVFLSRDPAVEETRWLAYPEYRPPSRPAPPLVLHRRLYYLNAVEWAASAMEMSAIAARNAALLAHHRWHAMDAKIDQEDLHARLRGEL
ncbi:hypothetical protein CRUP_018721 [Coryphaenoides rupestris]|nr:hypothetical protein CRUP_018721 [Coryphaenoides rupestris]